MRMLGFRHVRHMHRYFRAVGGFFPGDLRPLQSHMWILRRMERDQMSLVDGILGALEPVTIFRAGADHALAILFEKQIIGRQERRGIWTDVGENETSDLLSFIRRVLDTIFESTVRGFGGLLEATAVHVIKPAVITAADALILHSAEFQRRAAMRAM